MDVIRFSDGWNGKLKCKCFTTFRLATAKYQINKTYRIELKGQYIGTATIKGMRIMKLYRVNEFISFLDELLPWSEMLPESIRKPKKIN